MCFRNRFCDDAVMLIRHSKKAEGKSIFLNGGIIIYAVVDTSRNNGKVATLSPKIKTHIILGRVLMRLGVWNRFSCIIIFVEHVMVGLLSVDSSW
jgi:hypothetical protein